MAEASEFDVHLKPLRRDAAPFSVGSVRQLFFDDFFFAFAGRDHWDQIPHNIRFSLGRVEKHGAPLLEGDASWENSSAWLNVLREDDRFRMWYHSGHADRRGGRVSYAESADGVHWEKPGLGQIEAGGSDDNNIVFEGGLGGVSPEFGNVFRDPNAAPGEEYKMVYAEWLGEYIFEVPGYSPTNGTLRGACSPDGRRWTRYYENFLGHYPDSQNVACWDPTLGKYVIYHRSLSYFGELEVGDLRAQSHLRGRAVGRMESRDFRQWSTSELVLEPDLEDGLNSDIYNSAYSRHPDNVHAHYLFPSFYRHYEGTFEVQVCSSRDNRHWARPCRDTFIPLGEPGAFDCFIISVSPGIVALDDSTWALYYRSGDGPHGGSHPIELDYEARSRVSRVTFERDRILGLEGAAAGGHFATRPLAFSGSRLVLNAEPTGPEPQIRVQLLDAETGDPIEKYTFETCRPLCANGLDMTVVWQGGEQIGDEVSRRAVRLHFEVRSMRLYAFQFLP